MSAYHLAPIPPLTVGAGARREIGRVSASLASGSGLALLVADPGLATTGMVEQVAASLDATGLAVVHFTDIKSDPTLAQADAALALARGAGASVVVALGGGSALDLGKAVAAGAGSDAGLAAHALAATAWLPGRLPIVCVPTTSGTGSETTRTAILSAPDGAKLWFWGEELKPDHAVLDPELTVTLPPALTAATGIDALVHAVEASTNRNANAGNDVYAHAAIRLVGDHLVTAVRHPGNLTAREGLARAAALGGTAIDNCGTSIAHTMGHAMASLRPIHHGRAVGVAMLAALPWLVGDDPGGRFAACAAALGAERGAAGFIERYGALLREVGLRVAMVEDFAGVTPEALAAQMKRPENAAMIRSTNRDVTDADLLALARAVLALP